MEDGLYNKVIYYKGRLWTVYALLDANGGVFAFQGLKPYETFKYDSNRTDRNILYLKMDEALGCIIESEDEIKECAKKEAAAQAKKLSKKMAVEFLADLTGHSKAKINGEIKENYNNHFQIVLGQVAYHLFKLNGRLHLHHNTHGDTTGAAFDFVTWEHDNRYEDNERREQGRKDREEFIEEYKSRYSCTCDER